MRNLLARLLFALTLLSAIVATPAGAQWRPGKITIKVGLSNLPIGAPGCTFCAPTLTRISAAGVTPWDLAIGIDGTIVEGDVIHIQVSASSTVWTTLEQNITHEITGGEIAGGTLNLSADGLNLSPAGGPHFMRAYISRTSFTDTDYSNTIDLTYTPPAAPWVAETAPAVRDVGFASPTATFTSIHFGVGTGVVSVANGTRHTTNVTVCGVSATLIVESASSGMGVSMWRTPIASSTSCSVVVTGDAAMGRVAIATGTLAVSSATPAATSSIGFNYLPDPQGGGTVSVTTGGVALIAAYAGNTSSHNWTGATKDADVADTSGSADLSLTLAHATVSGSPTWDGGNYAGTASVTAVWAP